MKTLYEEINQILMIWNPIGVEQTIVEDEYQGYISLILGSINCEDSLIQCLEEILQNMGLRYNTKQQNADLREISKKIMAVYEKFNIAPVIKK